MKESVIPAQAGIQKQRAWIPAFAGMTLAWLFLLGIFSYLLNQNLSSSQTKYSRDPLTRLFGSVTEAFGDTAFLKASSYFHGGVSPELLHPGEGLGQKEDDEKDSFKKPFTDWIYKINSQIHVTEHRHLHGEETREILPFLELATKLDPYNVPAILTTAYWIDAYFGKTDQAIEILKKGEKDNPGSWEIDYQLGFLYFRRRNNYAESVPCFEKSLSKMTAENSQKTDHRTALFYLAESYSKENMDEKALAAYQKALALFGGSENLALKTAISEKIRAISNPHETLSVF